MNPILLCGIPVANFTMPAAIKKIISFFNDGECHSVMFPNAQHIALLAVNKKFRSAYASADLILADGMSLVFLFRLLGNPLEQRIAGVDFLKCLLPVITRRGKSIFLLKGGSKSKVKIIADKLKDIVPGLRIKGYYALPYDFDFNKDRAENSKVVKMIRIAQPDILIVSLGAPKQELWLKYNKDALRSIPVCLSVGAAPDFITGQLTRAPQWMQATGLEWMFRLIREPRRLWKRYLVGIPIFLYVALGEMGKKSLLSIKGKDAIKE